MNFLFKESFIYCLKNYLFNSVRLFKIPEWREDFVDYVVGL